MTGSYLRQLQLTKQLEQKAKQAADDRKAAEDRVAEAEEALRAAKEYGAEAAVVERSLVEATHAFSEKDYKAALELADRSIEGAEKAKGKRIEAILGSARELLDLPFPDEETSPEIEELIGSSTGAIAEDLGKAFESASRAWDLADQLANRRMADLFSRTQSLLLLAETNRLDQEAAKELVGTARSRLDQEDMASAIHVLQESLELLHESLDNEARSKLAELEERTGRFSTIVPIHQLDGWRDELSMLLSEGRFEEAFGRLIDHGNEADSILKEGMKEHYERLRVRLKALDGLGVDTSTCMEDVKRGTRLVAKEDLVTALEAGEELEGSINGLEVEALSLLIDRLRPGLLLSKQVGMDMARLMEYLHSARSMMRDGDFQQAMGKALELEAYLERELQGHQEVETALKAMAALMREADGLGVSPSKAMETLAEARGKALDKDFVTSGSLLERGMEEVHQAIQERFVREIMGIQLHLAQAVKLGVGVKKESDQLDLAIQSVRERDYTEVPEILAILGQNLDQKVAGATRKTVEWIRGQMIKRKGLVDVRDIVPLIEQAKTALDDGEYDRTRSITLEAERELKKLDTQALSRSMSKARRLIEISKELDCQSVTVERKYQRVKELQAGGVGVDAIRMAKEVMDHMSGIVGAEIDSRMAKLQRSMHAARKKDVDVTEAENILDEGMKALVKSDLDKAYGALVKAGSAFATITTLNQEIYDRIVIVSKLLEEAKVQGIDIKRPLSVLSETKRLFEKGRYNEAARSSIEGYQETERIMAPYIVSRKNAAVQETMRLLEVMGAEVDWIPPALEEVRDRTSKGEHAVALSLAKDLERRALGSLEGALKAGVEEAKDSLRTVSMAGVDISQVTQLLERSESLMDAEEHVDAVRAYRLARREMEQTLDLEKSARESLEESKEVFHKASELGIPLVLPQGMVMQAEAQLASRGYVLARELSRKAVEQVHELATLWARERVSGLIGPEGLLEGRDLDNVLSRWKEAEAAIDADRYGDLKAVVEGMSAAVERISRQRIHTLDTLKEVTYKYEAAVEHGICPESLGVQLERSNELVEQGAFSDAFTVIMRCSSELDSLMSMYQSRAEEAREMISRLELIGSYGIDIDCLMEELRQVGRALSDSDFEKATLEMHRISGAVRREEEGLCHLLRDKISRLTLLAENLGIDVPPTPEKGFREISGHLEGLRSILKSAIADRLEEVAAKVAAGGAEGKDIEMSGIFIAEARRSLDENELEGALEALGEAESNIGVDAKELEEYLELYDQAGDLIEEVNGLGVRTERWEEELAITDQERLDDLPGARLRIQGLIDSLRKEMEGLVPDIDLEMGLETDLHDGQWGRMTLYLINRSSALAKGVRISLEGIVTKGEVGVDSLGVGEERAVEVDVLPEGSGETEVVVTVTFSAVTIESAIEIQTAFVIDVL